MHVATSVSNWPISIAMVSIVMVSFAALGLTACGAGYGNESATHPVRRGGLPPTDRDPLPYTPPAGGTGLAGGTVALASSGGEDQARQMLPRLLIAMRDGDERQLELVLADEVTSVDARRARRQPRARASVIQRILLYTRRSIIPADAEPGGLVDLQSVVVTRSSQFWLNRDMPAGVRPTDLVVEVPVRDLGRIPLRTLLGWQNRGHLVVRAGRDPRVVAL